MMIFKTCYDIKVMTTKHVSGVDPHLEYILNKPGAPLKLYVNGYPYYKHDIQNDRTYWRCFKSNKAERYVFLN